MFWGFSSTPIVWDEPTGDGGMTNRQIGIGVISVIGIAGVVWLSNLGLTWTVSPNRNAVFHATRLTLEAARDAIESYKADKGSLPPSLDALPVVAHKTAGGGGYILSGNRLRDAWGHEFQYHCGADGYELRSAGPDGMFQTRDDVVLKR